MFKNESVDNERKDLHEDKSREYEGTQDEHKNLRLQDNKNGHIKRHQMVNQMRQIGIEDLRVEKMQQKKIQKLKQYKMILLESK